MFCPQCGAEYRRGFRECSDCNVALVDQPPHLPVSEPIEFVTVLENSDPAQLLVAKSVLEGAGIRYFAKGEGVQDFFAAGRLGTGFNPMAGPIELQVERERADEARALLTEIEDTDTETAE